jgi:hypothetical protein
MILAFTLLLFFSSTTVFSIDVDAIIERSDEISHPVNLTGVFAMTLTSRNGDTRTVKVEAYQKKTSAIREDRLFLFTFPPSVKGTGLLVNSYLNEEEDLMYIYLPAVGKVKRVNLSSSGGGYFMGSDFTYADLITSSREELDYNLLGEESLDGEICYKIEIRGKNRDIQRKYGYATKIHFIRKSDFVAKRVVFYDMAGELLKIFYIDEVAELGDYRYPSHVRMENEQTGHKSEIVFSDLQTTGDLPDRYFTQRYLQSR